MSPAAAARRMTERVKAERVKAELVKAELVKAELLKANSCNLCRGAAAASGRAALRLVSSDGG